MMEEVMIMNNKEMTKLLASSLGLSNPPSWWYPFGKHNMFGCEGHSKAERLLNPVLLESLCPRSLGYMSAGVSFTIKFNGPATIVFWSDGTKTTAVCHEPYDGEIDPVLGFCINYFKKHSGLSNNQRKKLFERVWGETPFIAIANGKLIDTGKDPVLSFFKGFFRSHYGGTVGHQNAVLQRVEGAYKRCYRRQAKRAGARGAIHLDRPSE